MAFYAPSDSSPQFCSAGQSQSHPHSNDDNLSFNRSHSGLFSYASNVTINGGRFNSIGGSISTAQNEHGEKLEQNLDALGLIPGLRVCRSEDLSMKTQFYKGRGYRLHPGRTDGSAVVVKVFAGRRAKELCLKAVKLHRKLMHPSFFRMVAGPPRDSELPFIVFAGDYERTLESRLWLALKKDIKESIVLGLQTVISGSLGLDYLQDLGYPLLTAGAEHLVLVTNNQGDIVVDFDPEVAWDPEADPSSGPDPSDDRESERGLELFNELIQKTFYAPCRSHYIGQRAYFGDATSDESDEELSQSGIEEVQDAAAQSLCDGSELAEPVLRTRKKSKSSATGHRRELVWKSQVAQTSLEQISQRTQDYLDKFLLTSVLNRRRGRPIANITHQCPGYQRTEIMLTSDIERSAIVAHTEPIPGEICPVCKKVVENVRDTRVPTSHTAVPGPLDLPLANEPVPAVLKTRGQTKRLTTSSIPFFRKSSSESMQVPPPSGPNRTSSPPFPSLLSANQSYAKQSTSPSQDYSSISTLTPRTSHKKSSMLSLGLPSLLKSSSRRNLHSEAKDAAKELQRPKDAARDSEKERIKHEKERQKKEDRKTLSSSEPSRPKSPVNLPPMQMSALEPVTAQRVAKLKSNAIPVSSLSNRTSSSSSFSRLTSQTVNSMQKQSDTSLRSRNQPPTIVGSPSVGTIGTSNSQTLKESQEPPSSLMNSTSGLPKETPTKIPRISSRTLVMASPPLKNSTSALATRRASNLVVASSTNASSVSLSTNEFGAIENEDGTTPKVRQATTRGSPTSNISASRLPRQAINSGPNTSQTITNTPHKTNRDSISIIGLRKSSTNSVASLSGTTTASETTSHHRFSALSPSKGLKLLAPKSFARASTSGLNQSVHQPSASLPSSRQSLSTPSPLPSTR